MVKEGYRIQSKFKLNAFETANSWKAFIADAGIGRSMNLSGTRVRQWRRQGLYFWLPRIRRWRLRTVDEFCSKRIFETDVQIKTRAVDE